MSARSCAIKMTLTEVGLSLLCIALGIGFIWALFCSGYGPFISAVAVIVIVAIIVYGTYQDNLRECEEEEKHSD
jgi:hypothetical protein